jgi:hypothetical protein
VLALARRTRPVCPWPGVGCQLSDSAGRQYGTLPVDAASRPGLQGEVYPIVGPDQPLLKLNSNVRGVLKMLKSTPVRHRPASETPSGFTNLRRRIDRSPRTGERRSLSPS